MADHVTTLPAQETIYGDAPWTERLGEKARAALADWGPTPEEIRKRNEAASEAYKNAYGSPGATASTIFGHALGPLAAGVAPETAGAAAAVGGVRGAIDGYEGEHPVMGAVKGAAMGALTSAAAAKLFGARPALKGGAVAQPERDPANMLAVAKSGKEAIKKLDPVEAEARRRWVHTNSSEIQAADAKGITDGEYGKLAQTLKSMAAKHPSPPATLYRGAHLPAEAVDQMSKSGKMSVQRMESWSTNPETSQAFARGKDIAGKVPVIFRQHNASGLALNPLESEVLIPNASNYKVLSVGTAPDGSRIIDVAVDTGRAARDAARHGLNGVRTSETK